MVSMNRAHLMQSSGGYINDVMERRLKTSSSFELFLSMYSIFFFF